MWRLHLPIVLLVLGPKLPAVQESRVVKDPAALLEALAGKDFATRRDAIKACRGRTEPELLAELRRMARKDGHPNLRAWALEVVIASKPGDLFDLLTEVLEREQDVFPRQVALLGMGQTRDPRAWAVLEPLLAGREAAHAARGLAALGDGRAFEPIAKLLEEQVDQVAVRDHVPAALLTLDHARGVERLLHIFAGKSGLHCGAIAPVLAREPTPRVRAAMVRHLDDPDPTRRAAAVRVLTGIADVTCLDALLRCFDQRAELRESCALALANTGLSPAARPLCERLRTDEEPRHRIAIAGALRSLKDRAIVPDLLKALAREDDDVVRVQIVAALGVQGEPRAVATLVALLDDETVTRQPLELSRILTFPHNVRLGDVAVWAVATLVDGKQPFPVESLSGFPRPRPKAECTAARERVRAWWQALADKAPYGAVR